MHLKQRHHNQHTTNRKPKTQFLSQTLAKRLSKIQKKKNHQDIHTKTYNDKNRSTAIEQSVKILLGWEWVSLNRFLHDHKPRP